MKLNLIALILTACLAQAATLTNAVVSTQFSGPYVFEHPTYRSYGEFRPVSNSGVVTQFDGAQTFTSHFGAIAAVQSGVDAPAFGMLLSNYYQLSFTIEDPLNNGYSLSLGHNIVGYINAAFDVDNSLPGSGVGARYQGVIVEWLNPTLNWVPLPNLELATATIARADEDEPELSRFLLDGASETVFFLSGTRNFQFRFNFELQAAAGDAASGEAAVRLGLDPCTALPSLVVSCTPGPDGTPIDQLGHFATVRVDSFGGPINNEVPEPATLLTTAAALAVAIRVRYRR